MSNETDEELEFRSLPQQTTILTAKNAKSAEDHGGFYHDGTTARRHDDEF